MPTSTGARPIIACRSRPSEIERRRATLAAASASGRQPPTRIRHGAAAQNSSTAVAKDLQAHRGTSLVIAGEHAAAVVHALAHAINAGARQRRQDGRLHADRSKPSRSTSSTRCAISSTTWTPARSTSALILGGNPVYTAPADLDVRRRAWTRSKLRVHLGLYDDETSALCHWQIPEAHFLEAWSDARAFDGTASIVQPLIAPLYGGKSAHELLAAMSDRPERSGYDIVRELLEASRQRADFETLAALAARRRGPEHRASRRRPCARSPAWPARRTPAPRASGTRDRLPPRSAVLDGRFANNGWLQELPKPITKLTWDNAVLVSPATAARLQRRRTPRATGGEHGRRDQRRRRAEVPRTHRCAARCSPSRPCGRLRRPCTSATAGRARARRRRRAGFNAYALRTSDAPWLRRRRSRSRTPAKPTPLACTQYHHLMEGRGIRCAR